MLTVLIFLFGLIWGSFLNVLVLRLDKKGGILNGRSECPRCSTRLKWMDLIPVLSFLFLKGKCRYCQAKISRIYPSVEILTGLLFVAFFLKRGFGSYVDIYDLVMAYFFLAIIFFDYLYYIIPDKITYPLIILALIFNYLYRPGGFIVLLTSGLLLASFFVILYLLSRGNWVGLGDAKLSLLIGLVFGYPNGFLILIFSIWVGAIVGIMMMLVRKASLKTALPFGSFLSLASILFIIFKYEVEIFKYLF